MARISLEKPSAGEWWRYSGYTYAPDGTITPARGAQLKSYDPWAGYELQPISSRAPGEKTSLRRPYLALVELYRRLEFADGGHGYFSALSERSKQELLGWCRTHGLLGVLPDQLMEVGFSSSNDGRPDKAHSWTTRGWRTDKLAPRRLPHQRGRNQESRPRRATNQKVARPAYAGPQESFAILRRDDESSEHVPFDEACARFLRSPDMPTPLTQRFWETYVEPWEDFFGALSRFSNLVFHYAEKRPRAESSEERAAQRRAERRMLARLNAIAFRTIPIGRLEDEGYSYYWLPRSLLSSYAQMLLQDVVGERLTQCENCAALFVSPFEGRFCKDRCSWAGQKRSQRARKKRLEEAFSRAPTSPKSIDSAGMEPG